MHHCSTSSGTYVNILQLLVLSCLGNKSSVYFQVYRWTDLNHFCHGQSPTQVLNFMSHPLIYFLIALCCIFFFFFCWKTEGQLCLNVLFSSSLQILSSLKLKEVWPWILYQALVLPRDPRCSYRCHHIFLETLPACDLQCDWQHISENSLLFTIPNVLISQWIKLQLLFSHLWNMLQLTHEWLVSLLHISAQICSH